MTNVLSASEIQGQSFGKIMDQCCDNLKATLIEAESFELIKRHADFFPVSLSRFWGFEIPLNGLENSADFLFCISEPLQCFDYFFNTWQANFSHELPGELFLPGIRDFSVAWCEAKTLPFKCVVNIWFEYDFQNIQEGILKPNFFYAPAKGTHPFAVVSASETIFKTISGSLVSKLAYAHLLHCLHQLPVNGWVSQIGMMFARNEHTLRLFIQQIPRNGIKPYLEKIHYRYAADEQFNKLLEDCYQLADQVDLNIDVSDSTGDTIGLECSFNEMQRSLDFLDVLFLKGWCKEQKYHALHECLVKMRVEPGKDFQPFFSHFKIVFHPHRPVKTKVYIGYAEKTSASKMIKTKPLNH
ncbi:MAG: hypothetical protein ABI921_07435 [Panacibacter sp.]